MTRYFWSEDLDQFQAMRTFTAVVEENGITAAATRLGISKALVSKTISQLENRLQVRLLNRTTRRIALTEAGSNYLEHCRSIIEQVDTTQAELARQSATLSGTLRVSAPVSFGQHYVVPLANEFAADHPEVVVDLALADRFVDLVEEGIDLAVRVGHTAPQTAIMVKLLETRHLLVAAPDFLADRTPPRAVSDVEGWPVLEYTLRDQPFSWRDSRSAPTVRLRSNSGDALLAAAEAGLGLAYLPEFMVASALASGRLVAVLPEETTAPLPVVALYPSRHYLPAKTRRFLDFLRARLN
ncbi:MAG: LysR family transcriptional regulator [Pseudomonadota bacterium]